LEQEILVFISDFKRKVVVWAITLTYFFREREEKMEKKGEKIEHKNRERKKKHLNG